jgi:hypothetical protein
MPSKVTHVPMYCFKKVVCIKLCIDENRWRVWGCGKRKNTSDGMGLGMHALLKTDGLVGRCGGWHGGEGLAGWQSLIAAAIQAPSCGPKGGQGRL